MGGSLAVSVVLSSLFPTAGRFFLTTVLEALGFSATPAGFASSFASLGCSLAVDGLGSSVGFAVAASAAVCATAGAVPGAAGDGAFGAIGGFEATAVPVAVI